MKIDFTAPYRSGWLDQIDWDQDTIKVEVEMTDELTGWDQEIEPGDVLHFEMTAGDDHVDVELGPDAATEDEAEAFRQAAERGRYEPTPEPDPVEPDWLMGDGTEIDHDFMASDWLPFTIGALCSSAVWFIIFLAAKLLP